MNKFALIGHPLGHSMSPLIHEKLFALSGLDNTSYELIDIAPEDIAGSRGLLESLRGLNVTIPPVFPWAITPTATASSVLRSCSPSAET